MPLTRPVTLDSDDGKLLMAKKAKKPSLSQVAFGGGSSVPGVRTNTTPVDGRPYTPGNDPNYDGRASPTTVDNDGYAEESVWHRLDFYIVLLHYCFLLQQQEELRCVIAVIRHGDRTPKQKMKVKVTEKRYLDYFHSYAKNSKKDVKVKSKVALLKFLEVTREIVADPELSKSKELIKQLKQIKDVLERWEISGINRKLQMKPQKWAEGDLDETIGVGSTGSSSISGLTPDLSNTTVASPPLLGFGNNYPSATTTAVVSGSSGGSKNCGVNGNNCEGPPATELLLVLKWGGDLTPLGRRQAEKLGKEFRTIMYPGTVVDFTRTF
jgi:hypothetical protein